jgi:hypothetical protein
MNYHLLIQYLSNNNHIIGLIQEIIQHIHLLIPEKHKKKVKYSTQTQKTEGNYE